MREQLSSRNLADCHQADKLCHVAREHLGWLLSDLNYMPASSRDQLNAELSCPAVTVRFPNYSCTVTIIRLCCKLRTNIKDARI